MRNNIKIKFIFLLCCLTSSYANDNNGRNYDQQYYDLATRINSTVGILVITFNRPDYLQQVINALEKTPQAATLPFVFILDGGPLATQKENQKIINNAQIKNKFIVARSSNYGCGRSIIDARRFMFEWCKFKKVILFEDDLVVSPDYITVLLNLHDWAQKNYDDIGVVQCFNRCYLNPTIKKEYANFVYENHGSFWGYCMNDTVYYAIKPLLDEHEKKHLININDSKSNCKLIAEWFIHLLAEHKKPNFKRIFPKSVDHNTFFKNCINKFLLSYENNKIRNAQDYEVRLALFLNGYKKVTTLVNRAKYIGEYGFHSSSSGWHKRFFNEIKLDLLKNEQKIHDFTPIFTNNNNSVIFNLQNLKITKGFYWMTEILKENNIPFNIIYPQVDAIPFCYYNISDHCIIPEDIPKGSVLIIATSRKQLKKFIKSIDPSLLLVIYIHSKRGTLSLSKLPVDLRKKIFAVIMDKSHFRKVTQTAFPAEKIHVWDCPQNIIKSVQEWNSINRKK